MIWNGGSGRNDLGKAGKEKVTCIDNRCFAGEG